MLRSLKSLERFAVDATDGALGTVINFLFDDESWTVRYLVVETGSFFDHRRVLVSPLSFRSVRHDGRRVELALTRAQIQGSPGVDVDLPVSRQHEADYYEYYGYPSCWGPANARGMRYEPKGEGDPGRMIGDGHLRSAKELRGYSVRGNDGRIGSIVDFLVDDGTWGIVHLVVCSRPHRSGRFGRDLAAADGAAGSRFRVSPPWSAWGPCRA
jgi:hypothetical protein